MIIRKTAPFEISRVLEILSEGRAAIARLGIDQWQDGYPNREVIVSDVEKGISHVLLENGIIEGTAVLMTDREPTYDEIFDGGWLTQGDNYFTIHRIALGDRLRGKGAASFVIDTAVSMAKSAGCVSVRVDTHEGNIAMRKMLEKNGFVYCGTIFLEPSRTEKVKRVAYERVL